MSNNIQVTVTMEDFEKIDDPNKKLNLIYRVVSAQQNHCVTTVERIEKNIKSISTPQLNTKKVAGVGVSGGVVGAFVAKCPEIIQAIGDWFHK
jgi:hypothetical protein